MKADGELAQWLDTAQPGCCPCGRPLPPGHEKLCGRKACRTKYLRLYARDRTPTLLKRVLRREPVPGRPRYVRLSLECGHTLDTPYSKSRRSKRRHCRECPASNQPGPTLAAG